MKKRLKFLLFFFLYYFNAVFSFAQVDSVFVITGKINGLPSNQWVFLQNKDENQTNIDSVFTKDGSFNFQGIIKTPSLFYLKIGDSSKQSFPFFLENGNISMDCDFKYPFGCQVKGSYNQHLIDEFAIIEKIAWNESVIEKMKATYANYDEKAGVIRKQIFSDAIKSFSLLHTNDKAIAYLVSVNSNYILDNELELIYNNFGENLKRSIFANEIHADIFMRNATKLGKNLYGVHQKDLNGEKVDLWDFREKYVLLYFWASGFEQARIENVKLKSVYDKYKNKEFEVMAVSLDSLESEWNRAVLEDNLTWQNVSDLRGWDNEIAKKLGILAIPYNILVDREGVIIGRDLRAEEIDNILNLIVATREAASLTKNTEPAKKRQSISQFFKKILVKKPKDNSGALPGASH